MLHSKFVIFIRENSFTNQSSRECLLVILEKVHWQIKCEARMSQKKPSTGLDYLVRNIRSGQVG